MTRGGEDEDDGGGVHGPEEEGESEPGEAGGAHGVEGDDEVEEITLFDTKMVFRRYDRATLRSDTFISRYL